MRRLLLAILVLLASAGYAQAHPTPFSYLDLRVAPDGVDVSLVAHIIDIAHDLGVDPPERLFEPSFLAQRGADVTRLLAGRLQLRADIVPLALGPWSDPEAVPDRQSLRIMSRASLSSLPGVLAVDARMFPYDPVHQTFVNVYEGGEIAMQAILSRDKTGVDYFSGTRQGTLAVVRRFVPSGIEHILIGPDHILFLVGLLLLGGTVRQLALVVSAFTLAHSITLSLAALNILNPPARIIEPAIALSIVYVGADNLMVKGGRDMRGWIAFGFGFIHGFGFANVLREMDLPRLALGWSLFSFNVGVEIGQLVIVAVAATLLGAIRARSATAGERVATIGSIAVILAGAYWFVERVFFSGAA
jgi:hydrogenase/urease accessory protein HupE